ncbi:MAG: sodium:calcium antiporter, partial [Thermoproteota archaeon]
SRTDALLLIAGYVLLMVASRHYLLKNHKGQGAQISRRAFMHLVMFFIYLAGVAIGSYMLVNSAILLSSELHIPEYIISFFVLALGTSLPELVVDITAIRKKEYAIALGDIIGSNIVDSTLSIAIGPLIAPIGFDGSLAFITGLWAFLVSLIVFLLLGLKKEMSVKMGFLFIVLYLLSYAILFID